MEKNLDYARQVGVEIIPALNMPGHMGAIFGALSPSALSRLPQLFEPGES